MTAPPVPSSAPSKRTILIQVGIAVVVLVLVFGFILPQAIDYRTVGEVLGSLTLGDALILIVVGLIVYVPEGWLYALCLPGMSLGRGISSWIASTAAASTTPGIDVAVRYGMGRSYGGTVQQTVLWIPLTGIFDNLVKFSLPVIAVGLIATQGENLEGLEWVAVIAGLVLVIGGVVVVQVFRSERFALSLSARVVSIGNWVLGKLHRDPLGDPTDRVLEFRRYAGQTIAQKWPLAIIASALGKLWTFVILLVALRMVDIPNDVIPVWSVFVVWAIVMLITAIPITPGGIGIAALAYVWLFSGVAGDEWADTIAAAVVLYRLAQWFLPIIIGWPIIWAWRRQIRRGELPDPFASAEPDASAAG